MPCELTALTLDTYFRFGLRLRVVGRQSPARDCHWSEPLWHLGFFIHSGSPHSTDCSETSLTIEAVAAQTHSLDCPHQVTK